ncbi:ORF1329 [White spot syndrome virus]|uniref:Wsv445 n=3 Tax=White spot syndrome virus TaxID=342409 RepID=Q8VAH0_WSSVS|nr:wsv445 [Shrimp white spot syndrome virus]AFX59822.1 wsv445 [White spot syndrome virus]AAL33446.1 wsv445 [Shrimp white spot syndrome virus]AAL89373.1 WSSV505 [Shrimp white spot syndrome virus]ATU83790.1 ORF1329 [White spot syndrome virus]AWQ60569.1 wsv445 [Shrimp white spot syndrome virus]
MIIILFIKRLFKLSYIETRYMASDKMLVSVSGAISSSARFLERLEYLRISDSDGHEKRPPSEDDGQFCSVICEQRVVLRLLSLK